MRNLSKNNTNFSAFFLVAYLTFLIIFSLHYHRYDLNEKLQYKDLSKENAALVLDFISDGLSICAIHHFSHSIIYSSPASKEILISFNTVALNFHKTDFINYTIDLLKNLPARASPLIG